MKRNQILLIIPYLFILFFTQTVHARYRCEKDIVALNKECNYALVFIDDSTRESIITLVHLLPDHNWSMLLKNAYIDFLEQGNVTLYQIVNRIIDESLDACKSKQDNAFEIIQKQLERYQQQLHSGTAYVNAVQENESGEKQSITRGTTNVCRLNVECLNVCGHLFVNGIDYTNLSSSSGSKGATGPTGPTGPTETAVISLATNIASCVDSAVGDFPLTQFVTTDTITNAPLAAKFSSTISPSTAALIADDCVSTNLNLAFVPKGIGALTAQIPDGTSAGGNARGTYAVDWQMSRGDPTQVASGANAVITGGSNSAASGNFSTIVGGNSLGAPTNYATIGCSGSTISSGDYTTCYGSANLINNDYATVAGGVFNQAQGICATILGGGFNDEGSFSNASGDYSTVAGCNTNFSFGSYSTVSGTVEATAGNTYDSACMNSSANGGNSFAAGLGAAASNQGSFVWSDSTGGIGDTGPNQFVVQATGGTIFNSFINISGSLQVNGTKSFDIPHPDPEKIPGTRLRHCCVESPSAGDTLYRYNTHVTDGIAYIQLPDYFSHLNDNVQAWVKPVDSFGLCYADCDDEKITVHASIDGTYNVLLIGTRKDHAALESWQKTGVEYITKDDVMNAIKISDDTQKQQAITRGTKNISRLNVNCLNVCNNLFVNGVDYTNLPSSNGSQGATGATGPTGPAGSGSFANQVFSTALNITPCINSSLMDFPLAQFITTTTITNAPLAASFSTVFSPATAALIADDCTDENLNLALVPKGIGALTANIPDGTIVGGNARGQNAVDWQMVRNTSNQIASGNTSVIAGGTNNMVSGPNSTIIGGINNQITGDSNIISGGNTNVTTGFASNINGGQNNTVQSNYCFINGGANNNAGLGDNTAIGGGNNNSTTDGGTGTICGGQNNQINGPLCMICGGQNNSASNLSMVCGGYGNNALGAVSFAAGTQSTAHNQGSFVWSDSSGGASDTGPNQFVVQANGGTTFFTDPFTINGNLVSAGKSFDIIHPNPEKSPFMRLRHSCVESPNAGDNIYRYTVQVTNGVAEIKLPDYFKYLNGNVHVCVNSVNNFGMCYACYDSDHITVHANTDGIYNVLIIGTRIDSAAVESWEKTGVEYVKNKP